MEKIIFYALSLLWCWFTMYWSYTISQKESNSWRLWQISYVLSAIFTAAALYLQYSVIWGILGLAALAYAELNAFLVQGVRFPFKGAVIARRLGELLAFALLIWIAID